MSGNFEAPGPQKESVEKYGNNVRIEIDLARHGRKSEYNSQNILNAEEISRVAAQADIGDADLLAVRSSPVPRAVRTGIAIVEGLRTNPALKQERVNVRVSEIPTGIASTEGTNIPGILADPGRVKDIYRMSKRMSEEYGRRVKETPGSTFDQENAGVAYFVDLLHADLEALRHVRHDLRSSDTLSSEALAELTKFKVAQEAGRQGNEGGMSMLEVVLRSVYHFLGHYSEVSNRSKNNSKTLIYETNHAGYIEPFLLYVIGDQIAADPVAQGNTDIEKIGGAFRPNEACRISIQREKKNGDITVSFVLRGKEYALNGNQIRDIITQSEKLRSLIKMYE